MLAETEMSLRDREGRVDETEHCCNSAKGVVPSERSMDSQADKESDVPG